MRALVVFREFLDPFQAGDFPYSWGIGLAEALENLGIKVVAAPAFADADAANQSAWNSVLRQLITGEEFDTVLVDAGNDGITPETVACLARTARVTIGFVPDTLGIAGQAGQGDSPWRGRSLARLSHCTHAAFADERDLLLSPGLEARWLEPAVMSADCLWQPAGTGAGFSAPPLHHARTAWADRVGGDEPPGWIQVIEAHRQTARQSAQPIEELNKIVFGSLIDASDSRSRWALLSQYVESIQGVRKRIHADWLNLISSATGLIASGGSEALLQQRSLEAVAAGADVHVVTSEGRDGTHQLLDRSNAGGVYAPNGKDSFHGGAACTRFSQSGISESWRSARVYIASHLTREIQLASLLAWANGGAEQVHIGTRRQFAEALDVRDSIGGPVRDTSEVAKPSCIPASPAPQAHSQGGEGLPSPQALSRHADRKPLLTCVVAAYNAARTLARTLGSLVASGSDHPLEILVIDDGSTDETASIAAAFASMDSRIRVIRQHNRGLGAVRNLGLREARGVFVTFCDADDIFFPNNQLALAGRMEKEGADIGCGTGFSLVAERRMLFFADTHLIRVLAQSKESHNTRFLKHMVQPSACTKLFRKEYILRKGLQFTEGRLFEDVAFTILAMLFTDRICFQDSPVFLYDVHGSGSITSMRSLRRFEILDNIIPVILNVRREIASGPEALCLAASLMRTVLWCYDYAPDDATPNFAKRLIEIFRAFTPRAEAEHYSLVAPMISDAVDRRALDIVSVIWMSKYSNDKISHLLKTVRLSPEVVA